MGRPRKLTFWLLGIALALPGCKRSDTECLSKIGRKLVDRTQTATAGFREKLAGWKAPVLGSAIEDKVSARLRWEKILADQTIEVVGSGKEIELKGTVASAEQRQRAIELAESTAGVDRVTVNLIVGQEPARKAENAEEPNFPK